jgi:protein Tex
MKSVIGNTDVLKRIDAGKYVDDRFGLPTVRDILKELEKPGRDPRPAFKTATFQDGVNDLKDLQPGMQLEGVVTNVTNFGAFIDIGVHQDGLVHISALSEQIRQRPARSGQGRRHRQGQGAGSRCRRKRVALTMRGISALLKDMGINLRGSMIE